MANPVHNVTSEFIDLELRLPAETAKLYEDVAKLAGVSVGQAICVMVAIYTIIMKGTVNAERQKEKARGDPDARPSGRSGRKGRSKGRR